MDKALDLCRKFDEWWFGHHSPASLGVLRILMGAMAILALTLTLFLFNDFYAPNGFTPNPVVEGWLKYKDQVFFYGTPLEFQLPFGPPRLSLLAGEPSYGWTLAVYLSTMVLAVLYTFGIWTRWVGFGLIAGLISIHTRNPLIIHSGDSLLRLCLIYLAFSPAGAMYSVDAWLKRKRMTPDERAAFEAPKVRVTGQRLIQFQLAVVYLCTAWWKFMGTFWMDGTATWYPAQMHEFRRFPLPQFLERQPFLALETYGTLAVEIALGTLVFWRPARKWVLILGILMHAYIEYRFNIPMFAIIIVSAYVAFYDGEEVQAWIARMKERFRRRETPAPLGNLTPDAGE
jgi:hypothetical protein